MTLYIIGLMVGWIAGSIFTGAGRKKVTHCRDCVRRNRCQIREQALGDDGYCSMGLEG